MAIVIVAAAGVAFLLGGGLGGQATLPTSAPAAIAGPTPLFSDLPLVTVAPVGTPVAPGTPGVTGTPGTASALPSATPDTGPIAETRAKRIRIDRPGHRPGDHRGRRDRRADREGGPLPGLGVAGRRLEHLHLRPRPGGDVHPALGGPRWATRSSWTSSTGRRAPTSSRRSCPKVPWDAIEYLEPTADRAADPPDVDLLLPDGAALRRHRRPGT